MYNPQSGFVLRPITLTRHIFFISTCRTGRSMLTPSLQAFIPTTSIGATKSHCECSFCSSLLSMMIPTQQPESLSDYKIVGTKRRSGSWTAGESWWSLHCDKHVCLSIMSLRSILLLFSLSWCRGCRSELYAERFCELWDTSALFLSFKYAQDRIDADHGCQMNHQI